MSAALALEPGVEHEIDTLETVASGLVDAGLHLADVRDGDPSMEEPFEDPGIRSSLHDTIGSELLSDRSVERDAFGLPLAEIMEAIELRDTEETLRLFSNSINRASHISTLDTIAEWILHLGHRFFDADSRDALLYEVRLRAEILDGESIEFETLGIKLAENTLRVAPHGVAIETSPGIDTEDVPLSLRALSLYKQGQYYPAYQLFLEFIEQLKASTDAYSEAESVSFQYELLFRKLGMFSNYATISGFYAGIPITEIDHLLTTADSHYRAASSLAQKYRSNPINTAFSPELLELWSNRIFMHLSETLTLSIRGDLDNDERTLRLENAKTNSLQAAQMFEAHESPRSQARALINAAIAVLHAGSDFQAVEYLNQAAELLLHFDEPQWLQEIQLYRTIIFLRNGRLGGAREMLKDCRDGDPHTRLLQVCLECHEAGGIASDPEAMGQFLETVGESVDRIQANEGVSLHVEGVERLGSMFLKYLRDRGGDVSVLHRTELEGLSSEMVDTLILAGLRMHDLGKVGVRPRLLDASRSLEPDERVHMNTHVDVGVNTAIRRQLLEILYLLPEVHFMIEPLVESIRDHHERLDGRGTPRRLSGDKVGFFASMVGLLDFVAAQIEARPYRAQDYTPVEMADRIRSHDGFPADLRNQLADFLTTHADEVAEAFAEINARIEARWGRLGIERIHDPESVDGTATSLQVAVAA